MQYQEIDESAQWQTNSNEIVPLFERNIVEAETGYLEVIIIARALDNSIRVWHRAFSYRRIDNDVVQVGNTQNIVPSGNVSDTPAMDDLSVSQTFGTTKLRIRVHGRLNEDIFWAARIRGVSLTPLSTARI